MRHNNADLRKNAAPDINNPKAAAMTPFNELLEDLKTYYTAIKKSIVRETR